MSGDVLDYSSGWPPPGAVKAGGFSGVLRYAGTSGRPKNLTPVEATTMLDAGVPIGLVFEDTAGWMLGGYAAGQSAARAVLADAKRCGVGVRAVYFACDREILSAADMALVLSCLDGGAAALGLARQGVYGQASVISAALVGERAAWGWQTRAWSHGVVSPYAHLLQQIGYVYPGGVQCDRSTVLRPDWGQYPSPQEDDMPLTDDDVSKIVKAIFDHDVELGPNVTTAARSIADATAARAQSTAAAAGVVRLETALANLTQAVGDLRVAAGDPGALAAELRGVLEAVRFGFVAPTNAAAPYPPTTVHSMVTADGTTYTRVGAVVPHRTSNTTTEGAE